MSRGVALPRGPFSSFGFFGVQPDAHQARFFMLSLSVFRRVLGVCFLSALQLSCRSTPAIVPGIQPEFEALNPSRILAVPSFVLPDPGAFSSVDIAALETGNTRAALESKVTSAFQNQPGVNGVSFSTVRQAIGKRPNVWDVLDAQMRSTSLKLTSRNSQERAELSSDCLKRKNFLDFYSFCLAPEKKWVSGLNTLSAKVLNADSALLTAITRLEKTTEKNRYGIAAGLALVLVDTNTGKLIWGKQTSGELLAPEGSASFPEWSPLFESLLNDNFWAEFPGRKLKEVPANK